MFRSMAALLLVIIAAVHTKLIKSSLSTFLNSKTCIKISLCCGRKNGNEDNFRPCGMQRHLENKKGSGMTGPNHLRSHYVHPADT